MIYHDDSKDLIQQFDYRRNPSWRIFRIMAEFIDGFTFLSQFTKTITFFGSNRLKENHQSYQQAYQLAKILALKGYTILSGGGPGIMEAANKGAFEVKGESVGINIQMPDAQRTNPYVKKSIALNYFFTRKVLLAFSAQAFIYFPGGFGTLDEMFEISTLIQSNKLENKVPIILFGKDYWQTLVDWAERELLNNYQTVSKEDLAIWHVVDDIDRAVEIIENKVEK